MLVRRTTRYERVKPRQQQQENKILRIILQDDLTARLSSHPHVRRQPGMPAIVLARDRGPAPHSPIGTVLLYDLHVVVDLRLQDPVSLNVAADGAGAGATVGVRRGERLLCSQGRMEEGGRRQLNEQIGVSSFRWSILSAIVYLWNNASIKMPLDFMMACAETRVL